jgi:anti-sigma factor RsiW
MKVTRDVVVDLLPLYVAGEASADTRRLVEEFLGQDPELERQAREGQFEPLAVTGMPRAVVPPDIELRSLRRTHGLIRWQRLTYAWALTFSFVSLTTAFSFEGERVHARLLLFEYPAVLVPCVALALSCWANYFVLRRRARITKV